MKKYLMTIVLTMFFATIIQITDGGWEYDWIESCYGILCTDIEPRGDWNYYSDYCNQLFLKPINNTHGTFYEYCSI